MLLRSFTVQGSWNYETLIGAGFAYTLLPALRYIHGSNGANLDEAVLRHADLFNSHPYLATVAIGAVSRLEAERIDPAVVQRFKTALRGSLGSLGDRLVWTAWRPMAVLLGLCLLLAGAVWWVAVAVFLVVYNLLHVPLRILGLQMGAAAGLDVGRVLRDAPLQAVIEWSSRAACFLVGMTVVFAAAPAADALVPGAVTLGAILLGSQLGIRTRRVLVAALAGLAALALALGTIGHGA
jgi:mannose PTS system EIID component